MIWMPDKRLWRPRMVRPPERRNLVGGARSGAMGAAGLLSGGGAGALTFDVFAGLAQALATTWSGFNITYDAAADLVAVIISWESGASTLSGITLGGVAMTSVASSLASNTNRTEAYYILAADMPAGGTARSIVASFSANAVGWGFAWSFINAQQTSPIPVINTGSTAALALTRTGALDGSYLVAGSNNNVNTFTATHSLASADFGAGEAGQGQYGAAAHEGPVTAGNYTDTVSISSAARCAGTLLEILA